MISVRPLTPSAGPAGLFVLVLSMAPFGISATPAVPNEPCELHPGLTRQLASSLPGWRVVTLADLREPLHRARFREDHPAACPGKVAVDFYGDQTPAVALSLVQGRDAKLVLARPRAPDTWSLAVLDDTQDSSPVVWTEAPSIYADVGGDRTLALPHEAVVWCGYESWAILYGMLEGQLEKIWLSD